MPLYFPGIISGISEMRTTTQFRAASVAIGLMLLAPLQVRAEDVVVFAVASLTNALDEAAQRFERQDGAHAKISQARARPWQSR